MVDAAVQVLQRPDDVFLRQTWRDRLRHDDSFVNRRLTDSRCGSWIAFRPAHALVLLGRQVVPVFEQYQVLLDFEFDISQSRLKLFLARELEACFFVLGVGVIEGD